MKPSICEHAHGAAPRPRLGSREVRRCARSASAQAHPTCFPCIWRADDRLAKSSMPLGRLRRNDVVTVGQGERRGIGPNCSGAGFSRACTRARPCARTFAARTSRRLVRQVTPILTQRTGSERRTGSGPAHPRSGGPICTGTPPASHRAAGSRRGSLPAEDFARPHAVVHQHATARHFLRLRYRVQVVRGFELVGHGGEVLTPSRCGAPRR
jgi:hypothetical protein